MIRVPRASEPSPAPVWPRTGLGIVAIVVVGLAVVAGSGWARRSVDADLKIEGSEWRLFLDQLPAWFPRSFRGQLAELDRLPERVSLRPPHWRRRLAERIEANPWIARVFDLRRVQGRIYFGGEFVRPVAAVRAGGGFLLVDSAGEVIDFQPGSELHEEWRVPEHLPELGPIPRQLPGKRLRGASFAELWALLDVLWEARIFDRWPGVVSEVLSEPRQADDRLWVLRLVHGTELVWGRAPGSPYLSPLDVRTKLANLEDVLRRWKALERTHRIELWSDIQPLVVDFR